MRKNDALRLGLWTLLLMGFSALLWAKPGNFGKPQIDAVKGEVPVVPKVRVVDFGKTIYDGPMDVNPTLNRIRRGQRLKSRNDGAIFANREKRLPRTPDREYYREFVHRMNRMPFPGPQRVILGKGGEVFYTGDHYFSFVRVNP